MGLVSEYLKLIMPYGHLIVYGIIIVLVVLFMPQGVTRAAAKLLTRKLQVGGVDSASLRD